MSTVRPTPIVWVWANRIAEGAVTTLDGDPGTAKSTITYDLAARVTRGKNMPNCHCALPPGGVVLLQAEDDLANTVQPRLLAAGADLTRIRAFDRTDFGSRPLLLPNDMDLLESAAGDVQAKLVVLDPFAAFVAGATASEVSVRRALAPLAEMAQRLRLAILLVRHLAKTGQGAAHPLYRGAGSMAIAGAARSALLVGADPAHKDPFRRVLALAKTNLAATPSLSYQTVMRNGVLGIDWLGPTEVSADDLAAVNHRERPQLQEAREVLYAILAEGPVAVTAVRRASEKAGVSWRTVERAKKELGIEKKRHGFGVNSYWTWELPPDNERVRQCREAEIDNLMDRLLDDGDEGSEPEDHDR
jgi:RecA-family ATPase